MDRKSRRKIGVGIALCRRSPAGIPQILLVRSRVTYDFNSFLFGKYALNDSETVQRLLNRMTTDEKLIIITLDFSKMWYHSWLSIPDATSENSIYEFYLRCSTRFGKLISRDGGAKLKNMINNSQSVETGWEIPKGRLEAKESEIAGAIRELGEETRIPHTHYQLLHSVKPICHSYQHDTTIYVNKYYVARYIGGPATEPISRLKIDYGNKTQIAEISNLGWFGLADLNNIVHKTQNLKKHCRLALRLASRGRACPPPVTPSGL
jgi:8-oxo-dGTP pyrophosphatase MutT (NUDIX family)